LVFPQIVTDLSQKFGNNPIIFPDIQFLSDLVLEAAGLNTTYQISLRNRGRLRHTFLSCSITQPGAVAPHDAGPGQSGRFPYEDLPQFLAT